MLHLYALFAEYIHILCIYTVYIRGTCSLSGGMCGLQHTERIHTAKAKSPGPFCEPSGPERVPGFVLSLCAGKGPARRRPCGAQQFLLGLGQLLEGMEIVNEMLERGYKFGQLDLYNSEASEFKIESDTLIPPFVAMDGLGENVAKQIVASRAEGEFLSKTELRKRGGVSATLVEKMDDMGILGNMPEDNQLSLFDDFF